MAERLEGKVGVVTGGASGLGESIARKLAAEGAKVVVADLSDRRDEVASSLGEGAVAREVDVSDQASVEALEAWLRETYGHIDLDGQQRRDQRTGAPFPRVPDRRVGQGDGSQSPRFIYGAAGRFAAHA